MTGRDRTDCDAMSEVLLEHALAGAIDELNDEVRAHVSECAHCQAEYDGLRQAYEMLPPSRSAHPPTIVRRRVRSYARESAKTAVRSYWRLAMVGSGMAIAATLAIIMAKPDVTPPVVESVDMAPMFEALDVSTGTVRSFGEFKGQTVLLNFWATWCIPCESEMASMERLYRRYRDEGLVVVAVSVDRESRHKVLQWAEQHGMTFPVFQDATGEVEQLYRTVGVPESFVIDRSGAIVMRISGPRVWDDPVHSALVRDVLNNETPG
jgi:peroxiredoxin